jgi:hypothetical protein
MQTHIRNVLRFLGISVALFAVIAPQQAAAAVTNQSIAVPMYQYPTLGTFWDDITGEGAGTVPFVLLTPANGPGVVVDPNYENEIAENTADGIRSIGYVHTDYQVRDYEEVYEDIDDWYVMYPDIRGIFIDLVEDDTPEQLCYIAGLYNHVKNTHPDDLVILNPGTHISPDYEPYGDIFMNAENNYAAYESSWNIMYPGFEDNPAYQNRFWHSIHTIDPSDYADALALTRDNNAGWVYLTDDVMPNPYQNTPTFWDTEVADVNALPDTVIPNRGKTQLPDGCRDLTAQATNNVTTAERSTTTASNISVSNTSTTYSAEPDTSIAFTLPAGVTLQSATGSNWSCDIAAKECEYNATIAAAGQASVLGASFVADCTYTSGNVQGAVSNFAGNTSTFAVSPTRPNDCATAVGSGGSSGDPDGQLAETGINTTLLATGAAAVAAVALRVYFSQTRRRYVHATLRRR